MQICIISSSVRENSQSERISKIVEQLLLEISPECTCENINLKNENVPLWTEEKWSPDSETSRLWHPISKKLKSSIGFIFVVPEWAGMAPPHLKNLLLMCDDGELAHKPAQIISVSAGLGGTYPVAELRMNSQKNNFVIWLPDHVILRNVGSLFTQEQPTLIDQKITNKIKYSISFLTAVSKLMVSARNQCQDLASYKYGD